MALNILVVAAAYYATGKLGLALAIPPGYATAIWPPSGIALASIVLGGNRVWPGIWLGSFLVNISTGFTLETTQDAIRSLAIPGLISCGATLQALVGSSLLHRFGKFPNPLHTLRQILGLLMFGGLFGCLINASIGVSTLVAFGRIPLLDAPFTWLTWWGGDAIGVFVFTPSILALFMRPREEWDGRSHVIVSATSLTFALVVGLVAYASHLERKDFDAQLVERGERLAASLENAVTTRLGSVGALQAFVGHAERINFEDFTFFSYNLREHTPGILALEWIPVVASDRREAFEAWADKNGMPGLKITEKEGDSLVPAADRPDYYPVTFVEPIVENRKALGFDLGSDDVRKVAITRALKTGEIAVTGGIDLVQGGRAVLAVAAANTRRPAGHAAIVNQEWTSSFVLAVIPLSDLINTAFSGKDPMGLHYWVMDETLTGQPDVLASNTTEFPSVFKLLEHGLFGDSASLEFTQSFMVGGRVWGLHIVPTLDFVAQHRLQNAWFVLLGGLLMTCLMGVFVMMVTGKEGELRELVDARTQTLQDALGELGRSEMRYRSTFEQAAVGMVHTDFEGRFLRTNARFAEIVGYSPAEVVQLSYQTITPKAEIARSVDAASLLLDGKINTLSWEKRYIRKDGSLTWVKLTSSVQRDGGGQPIHFITVIEDINARKQAEDHLAAAMESLKKSEERFRSLVEGTTDWVWETDVNNCYTWVSSSFFDAVGLSYADIIGKYPWDLPSRESDIDVALWQSHIGEISLHLSFRDFRFWVRTADGQSKWLSISGTPLFNENGDFLGYRGIGTDLTAEAHSATRLKLLSTAVEQSPVSVVIADPEGVIKYVNSHFCAETGYAQEDVIGKTSKIISSGETPVEVYEDMWATILAGHRWSGELHNRRKDGGTHWEMVIIAPVLDEMGKVAHFVAIMEDITQRRILQERLTSTNAELEQFAYVASHDLRQPLRMVTSYLTIIEKQLGPQLSADHRAFFGFAVDGAKRMDRLILDLLEYSRTGRSSEFVSVSLGEAVSNALLILSETIRESEAAITVAPDLPVIFGNPTEIVRLFQNLIGNAVKYRSLERPPVVGVGWRYQNNRYLVWVKDNGMGIPAEYRERVFKIFQRLVSKEAYEGTGIGLAICKKIVEHHHGRIWVGSDDEPGSIIFMTFPIPSETESVVSVDGDAI